MVTHWYMAMKNPAPATSTNSASLVSDIIPRPVKKHPSAGLECSIVATSGWRETSITLNSDAMAARLQKYGISWKKVVHGQSRLKIQCGYMDISRLVNSRANRMNGAIPMRLRAHFRSERCQEPYCIAKALDPCGWLGDQRIVQS
jgi:hypothetical protein